MRICAAAGSLAGALALVLTAAGCDCAGCGADGTIARVEARRGEVERDHADAVGDWARAAEGDRLRLGDGLRTGDDGAATLDLSGARLEVEPSTEIRFQAEGADPRLEVSSGAVLLEATDEAARVDTSLGLAELERGTRVRITAGPGGPRLRVEVGAAVLEEPGQTPVTVEAGETLDEEGLAAAEPEGGEASVAEPPAGSGRPGGSGEGLAVATRGAVDRRDGERWVALEEGDHRLSEGTRLRLAERARATVRRGAGSVELAGRGEHVVGGPDGSLARVVSGDARVTAREAPVTLRVPGGVIVAEAAATGDVASGAEGTRVEAVRGALRVREGGEERVLEAGQSTRLGPPDAEAPAEGAPAPDGELSRVDLTLAAGPLAIVHAPRPPVTVRFDVTEVCPDGGHVRLRRRRALTHRLGAGTSPYRIECHGDADAERGRIVVLRDRGRARLPRTPPTSIIDADGRNYTVLYQNQLPSLRVRWPDAPERGPYRLRFLGGSAEEARSARASFALRSGRVREGRHRFVVEAGSERSPETTLRIRFDNAASTARILRPRDRRFAAGEPVEVAGIALPGWSVLVNGRPVALDPQGRFETRAAAPAGGALVIRLSHPHRVSHLYVRRPRGAR
ncbi:MAG TPA: hypothetical protein RMH99_00310 [Sandaracinaceae bacterium LLY-WYZ-13_1]|nr:hypothetical protein [Sandaracinaceae bacterium LLY-WYZ-13_1]